jgi:hypothetical protein
LERFGREVIEKPSLHMYSCFRSQHNVNGMWRVIDEVVGICEEEKNSDLSDATVNLHHNTGQDGLKTQQGGAFSESRPGHHCPD